MTRFQYKKVGLMSYEVRQDGILLGSIWRTRIGWTVRDLKGREAVFGQLRRDTAASALIDGYTMQEKS